MNKFVRNSVVVISIVAVMVGWSIWHDRIIGEQPFVSAKAVAESNEPQLPIANVADGRSATSLAVPEDGLPSPALEDLVLRFVTTADAVVEGVFVWTQGSEELTDWRYVGTSDASGCLHLSTDDHGLSIVAQHSKYIAATAQVAPGETGSKTIVMADGVRVSGRVVTTTGAAITGMPWVLLFPTSRPPTKADVALAVSGTSLPYSGVHLTRADERGYFEIVGIESDVEMSGVVGGGGNISPTVQKGLRARSGEFELIANPMFAVNIQLRDRTGVPLRSNKALWKVPGPQWTFPAGEFKAIGADCLQAVLAGLSVEQTLRQASGNMVIMLTSTSDAARIGPISFQGTPAGYSPCNQSVWAERVTDKIPVALVELEATTNQWGSLTVTFEGLPMRRDLRTSTRVQELGFLEFDGGSAESSWQYKLFTLPSEPLRLDNVPAGVYRVKLYTAQSYVRFSSTPDTIVVSETEVAARANFDMRQSCAVEVRIVDRDGKDCLGAATIELSRDRSSGYHSTFFVFSRAPYMFEGLLPEKYGFTLHQPFGADDEPRWIDIASSVDDSRQGSVEFIQP